MSIAFRTWFSRRFSRQNPCQLQSRSRSHVLGWVIVCCTVVVPLLAGCSGSAASSGTSSLSGTTVASTSVSSASVNATPAPVTGPAGNVSVQVTFSAGPSTARSISRAPANGTRSTGSATVMFPDMTGTVTVHVLSLTTGLDVVAPISVPHVQGFGSLQITVPNVPFGSYAFIVSLTSPSGTMAAVSPSRVSVASTSTSVTTQPRTLESLTISPSNPPPLAVTTTQQFHASGVFSDGSSYDLTHLVGWGCSATTVASVDGSGLVKPTSNGTATITATYDSVTATASLTVTGKVARSIQINQATASLPRGTTTNLTALATFTDGTTQDVTHTVTWKSSDANVASVDATGLASALNVGAVTVTATLSGVSGQTSLTVTSAILTNLAVTAPSASMALGTTMNLKATATYSDKTTVDVTSQANWNSADSSTAPVSMVLGSIGVVSAAKMGGPVTISATFGGLSANTPITVTAAVPVSLTVTPGTPEVVTGMQVAFKASVTFSDRSVQDLTGASTWSSGNATIWSVNATTGVALAQSTGNTTITASYGGVSGHTSATVGVVTGVSVTPSTATINYASTLQYGAVATFQDNTQIDITAFAHWSTSNSFVATSSTGGLVSTSGGGPVTVTASATGTSGSATLTVNPGTPATWAMRNAGQSDTINATFPLSNLDYDVAGGTPLLTFPYALVRVHGSQEGGVIDASYDGGTTWRTVFTFPYAYNAGRPCVVYSPVAQDFTVSDGGANVYNSYDTTTWAKVVLPNTSYAMQEMRWDGSQIVAQVYLGVQGASNEILTSVDGVSWVDDHGTSTSFGYAAQLGSGTSVGTNVVGAMNTIYVFNGGSPTYSNWWYPMPTPASWPSFNMTRTIATNGTVNLWADTAGNIFTYAAGTGSGGYTEFPNALPQEAIDVLYANGRFVIVMPQYTATISNATVTSGVVSLTPVISQKIGANLSLQGITWNNTNYVATGWSSPPNSSRATVPVVLTSTDGLNWSLQNWTEANYNSVAFGNNLFVAVGNGGYLITSPNGQTWTPRTSNTSLDITTVTYGLSGFVAFAYDTTDPAFTSDATLPTTPEVELTSLDGVTWTATQMNTTLVPAGNTINKVIFADGIYVAVGGTSINGGANTALILTSPDGITWTSKVPTSGSNELLTGVGFANGVFYAVGANTTAANLIVSNDNGATWSAGPNTSSFAMKAQFPWINSGTVAFGNGYYYADRNWLTFNTAAQCSTALSPSQNPNVPTNPTWTASTNGSSDVLYALGGFVSINNNWGAGTRALQESVDGYTWTNITSTDAAYLFGIAFGNNIFVVVGDAGRLLSSP